MLPAGDTAPHKGAQTARSIRPQTGEKVGGREQKAEEERQRGDSSNLSVHPRFRGLFGGAQSFQYSGELLTR